MTTPEPARIRACVFDAYGTLLDIASCVAREGALLGARESELAALWRRKQLEYTWLRSLMRRHADFAAVTADALDFALEALKLDDGQLRLRLLAAYRRLAPFADARPVLQALREHGMTVGVLSNGSGPMLADGLAAAGIADLLDPVLSIDAAGVFKPAPETYLLATTRLGLPAAAIAFVSANGWDVHGAATFGLRSIWVNRGRLPDDRLPGTALPTIPDLHALPGLLREAM